jgi:hypothetical protein
MTKKEPLYPHVPKKKEAQFPHEPSAKGVKEAGVLPDGQLVLLKSGTEGWVQGRIVEYFDLIPSVGGMIYAGPGYKVFILEGKHKGQTIKIPANYVKAIQPQNLPQTESRRQKYVHVLSPGQTVLHYDDTIALEVFDKENERVRKRGETPATGEILEEGKYRRLPQTTKKPTRDDVTVESWQERDRLGIWITDKHTDKTLAEWWDDEARQMFEEGFFKPGVPQHSSDKPARAFVESVLDYAESVGILAGGKQPGTKLPTTEKLYQRAADGYPIGADKLMRDAWGPIPNPDQPFWGRQGFVKPAKVYGWQWSPDYHSWRAYVRFPDGEETWTSPREQPGGSLELLASTEGDPIRKFCCRQCGECAPKELLEEGRFPDRIVWLKNHYKAKHPGMWGRAQAGA